MVVDQAENVLFFNSTRNYTLAILDSLNNVQTWTKQSDDTWNQLPVPITFGNYEKSLRMEDIDQETLLSGNFNFVPRMALSFDGMTKTPERDTNKFQKISKKVLSPDGDSLMLNFGYNSVAYDFQYTLLLQARGLNQALQIVEQILPMFRPSYTISVKEYPLFDDMTETQLLIEDPAFAILEDFEDTDVNIINVSFGLNIRGNLYMPLSLQAPIKVLKLLDHLWDIQEIKDSQRAAFYYCDVCEIDSKIYKETVEKYAPPKLEEPIKTEIKPEIESPCDDPDKFCEEVAKL